MNFSSVRLAVHRSIAFLTAGVAALLVVQAALAQSGGDATPTPTPGLPCPSMMNVHSGAVDPSLSVMLTATLDAEAREVTLEWTMTGPSKCAWIQPKPQGGDYPAFADFIRPPGAGRQVLRPIGQPGEFCWRVFAVSDTGHSEPAEACLQINVPNGPPPIVDGPFPTASPAAVMAGPNCPSGFDLADVPIDPTLHLTLEARWDDANRGIELSWTTPEHARCAWFQFNWPGFTYPGSPFAEGADFILAPGSSSRIVGAGGAPGLVCYRLFAFSDAGRSEPAEACLELDAGKFPTPHPPGTGSLPPEPAPPPANVRLEGRFELTDAGGNPLPWEQQTWFAGVSWEARPGFTGTYEVERRRVDPFFGHGFGPVPSGRIPASNAAFGRLESVEQLTPGTIWCFRVRAVVEGRYPGTPSEEVCMPQPASPDAPATTPTAPLPPDAGNTSSSGAGPSPFLLVPLFAAIAAVFALAATRPRSS